MGIVSDFFKLDREFANLLSLAYSESVESEDGQPSEDVQRVLQERAENKEEFVTQLGAWYIALNAQLEGKKAEYKVVQDTISADLKSFEKQLEFIEFVLKSVLAPGEDSEIVNESIDIRYRRSESIEIDNEDRLPIDFVNLKPVADKAAIKQAFKNGHDVPGAKLLVKWNPQIKPGGVAAMKRAGERAKKREIEGKKKAIAD